jgi:hypothetical protein
VVTRAVRRLVPPALLLALACNTGFEPQYRVTDLRILAVSAQVVGSRSADVSLVDAVQLETLVANPRGRAPLTVRWFACVPAALEAVPPCVDPEFLKDPVGLAAANGVPEIARGERPAAIPLSELAQLGGALEELSAAVIALALAEPTFRCRLYVELPLVVVAEADGARQVAVKRVRLVPRASDLAPYPELGARYELNLNLNPRVAGVLRAPGDEETCDGGAPLADPVPAASVLCARGDAPQPFEVCGPSGEPARVTETYSWQWYATDGEFPEFDGIGNATGGSVEFTRPPGAFTLWAIVRDGRGGEAWQRYDFARLP